MGLNTNITKNKELSGHETDKSIIYNKYLLSKGNNKDNGGGMLLFNNGKKKRFSVGSITFCRNINYRNSDNRIIIKNVINDFLQE